MQPEDKISLTYEQAQALGAKMLGDVGKARELTTADYNWPTTGTKTGIAPWLLDAGFYCVESGVKVFISSGQTEDMARGLIIFKQDSQGVGFLDRVRDALYYRRYVGSTRNVNSKLLTDVDIVDNLASYDRTKALSSYQGRVLNERIGDLTSLTTTAKTSAVAAINELNGLVGNVESALSAINNGIGV